MTSTTGALRMIDFTNCEIVPNRYYDGQNGTKACIIYEGKEYMLKVQGPYTGRIARSGYSNCCMSEHVGCTVLRTIGLNAQKTILGTYSKTKVKSAVACEDFTSGGKRFVPFLAVKNSLLDEDSTGSNTDLTEVLDTMTEVAYPNKTELEQFFWDQFIGDALIGNFDRHNGNWGFIIDTSNNISIAPIFDCGSCLYPRMKEEEYRKVLDDSKEINARIYNWPCSAIRINGTKINYYDFIASLSNSGCNEALDRLYPRIDIQKICETVLDMPELSDLQKEFYCTMLTERKEKILDVSYEKLVGKS